MGFEFFSTHFDKLIKFAQHYIEQKQAEIIFN